MSQINSGYAAVPGLTTAIESQENQITFGIAAQLKYWSAYIASTAADPTNSPTWRLRSGLVMGRITSTGQWTNYSPTATDGSEVAAGILTVGLRMEDVTTGSNTAKFYSICVGGNVKTYNLYGLDNQAMIAMSPQFEFDSVVGLNSPTFGDWPRYQTKTAAYSVVAADNFSLFSNYGASGAVTFTLPAIANGYKFGFRVDADQSITIASTEGNNIVAFNDAAASSLAFSTSGQKLGGMLVVYSNPAGTLWYAENRSAGTNTITVV